MVICKLSAKKRSETTLHYKIITAEGNEVACIDC